MTENKAKYNSQQKKAITFANGPLLIVAGAGTGKTMVITERIAHLILDKNVKTDGILALTFTDKAAGEMQERVDKLLPYGYVDLWVSTFHSFCQKILEQHALDIGLSNDFKLLNQTSAWLLVRQNLEKFDLDYYKPLGNPTKFIHALLTHFSRCKDEEIYPDDYLAYAEKVELDLDTKQGDEGLADEAKRLKEISNAYHVYQQLLLDNNALDFGDLINYTLRLFKQRKNILQKYQKQFEYILVDEFQDTNFAQYNLVKLLAGEKANLTVVADDDQCLPGNSLISLPIGNKKIKNLKAGDEVLTAIGRGQVGVSKIKRVIKSTKYVKYLTITTESGKKIVVTDNHKMFVYTPNNKSDYFYAYLMFRQDVGFRLGITNNLLTRLRLERSSDTILALKAFATEKEARYWETYWSLKYGIPTACFQERDGIVMKNELLKQLYRDLEVSKSVVTLAKDLNKDLNYFHHCLGAVYRGNKSRVKIILNICSRNYRLKKMKNFSRKYEVLHSLSIETSDPRIIKLLRENDYILKKAKKGLKYKESSIDLNYLVKKAEKLQKITGGICEEKFCIATLNEQSLPALVMPAKNLVLGNYIPVQKNFELFYEKIIEIKVFSTKDTVYDLEIEKTHNFITDGIVVHNSIYKFRGASVSNILQFKKDFPRAQNIVLTENYRSCQEILDLSYNFIQLNNPNRLEAQKGSKIKKQLQANSKCKAQIEHLHYKTLDDEIRGIIHKIVELKKADKEANWSDFAILVRANDSANIFINFLRKTNLPYQFVALRGLYSKPIILDILNYFKLLDNYHESAAVFRILRSPIVSIADEDLTKLCHFANKKNFSLYEALKMAGAIFGISSETVSQINFFLSLVQKHTALSREKIVGELLLAFVTDSKYLEKILGAGEEIAKQNADYLNQFYNRLKTFEESAADPSLQNFMAEMELELESGESGALKFDIELGPDVIKIMTVHSAKGLEFKYVFIPNLVDQRFPTNKRGEPIEIPESLVKDILPEGDFHLQEERRLFYVAMTRAKKGLFFTSADDYGGARAKKISQFLAELAQTNKGFKLDKKAASSDATTRVPMTDSVPSVKENPVYALPTQFSFSQITAFQTCPYQYKLAHIFKIPVLGKGVFSYGKSMHAALQQFFVLANSKAQNSQADLFGAKTGIKDQKIGELVSFDELKDIFAKSWQDEWFYSKEDQEKYLKKGRDFIKLFYEENKDKPLQTLCLEKGFNIKISRAKKTAEFYTIRGFIDRIDLLPDKTVELIDYKTGTPKEKLSLDQKTQLLLYQYACLNLPEITNGLPVSKLTFYYLDNNTQLSFLGTDKELDKVEAEVVATIEEIKTSRFAATPEFNKCKFCDFRNICEYKV